MGCGASKTGGEGLPPSGGGGDGSVDDSSVKKFSPVKASTKTAAPRAEPLPGDDDEDPDRDAQRRGADPTASGGDTTADNRSDSPAPPAWAKGAWRGDDGSYDPVAAADTQAATPPPKPWFPRRGGLTGPPAEDATPKEPEGEVQFPSFTYALIPGASGESCAAA